MAEQSPGEQLQRSHARRVCATRLCSLGGAENRLLLVGNLCDPFYDLEGSLSHVTSESKNIRYR